MPSSSGTSSSRPGSFLAPAARYRELHVNRTVYILGALVLVGPWVAWLMQLQAELHAPAVLLDAMGHGTVHSLLASTLAGFASGSPTFNTFTVLAAAAFGVALFGYDRSAGGLLYTLETPLRRRDVFAAKAIFGGTVVVLAIALGIAGTLVAAALSGNLALTGPILLRGLFAVTGQLSLFATALALGGAVGTVFSGLAIAFWAGLPGLLSGLLTMLFVPVSYAVPTTVGAAVASPAGIASLAQALPNLSPFSPAGIGLWSTADVLALIAWFVAWTAFMLWQGSRWWQLAPFERLGDGVFFPFLWNLYYAYLSLASGLFVTTLVTHGTVRGPEWALIYAAAFVAGWFFWRLAVTRQGRRAAWRHAVSART